MAKARKKTTRKKEPAAERPAFSLKQAPTPYLQQYLALVRKNELVALGAFFLLILLAVLAFAAPDYLNYKRSPKALKDKINSMQGARRTSFLEKKRSKQSADPRYTIINCELARSYYSMGEDEKALELFLELEEHYRTYSPPNEYRNVYAFLAKIHMKSGDYAKADLYITRAISLGGYDDEFKYLLGDYLLKAKRPVEAARWLELVVDTKTYGEKAQAELQQIEQEIMAPDKTP
jgi:predicted Zn-dependent protease